MPHYCYILHCADDRYDVGATADVSRRLAAHRSGWVPSTRRRRPVALAYYEVHPTAAAASQRERSLKHGRIRKATREQLVRTFPSVRLTLFDGAGR